MCMYLYIYIYTYVYSAFVFAFVAVLVVLPNCEQLTFEWLPADAALCWYLLASLDANLRLALLVDPCLPLLKHCTVYGLWSYNRNPYNDRIYKYHWLPGKYPSNPMNIDDHPTLWRYEIRPFFTWDIWVIDAMSFVVLDLSTSFGCVAQERLT